MIPRLRPGLVVARRDDRHLQVGLEPPHRVVLPDLPETRRLLDELQQGRPIGASGPRTTATLAQLAAADLLAPAPAPTESRAAAEAVLTGPHALVDSAAAALRAAGIAVSDATGVQLLMGHGAVSRARADPLVRDGIPHLVAVSTPWGWELGPFVVPGETACLRCVDAARRDDDPRYGVVLDQLIRGATPAPAGAALSAIAMGWVARDLTAHRRGERPSTWSTTVRLTDSPGPELVDERRWLRHPHCGCAWDALTG